MKHSITTHGQNNSKKSTSINNPELEQAILKTTTYFDLFDFPLTIKELSERLYQYHQPIHIKELKGTLNKLSEEGKVEVIQDQVFLKGRASILETRKQRQIISQKLWEKVNWYGRYLRHIPFVKMVAICNNLAYNNASETSDIDLFIVIQSGRMWLGRLFVTIVLQFFGVRRHGNKVAGRFCLSFFVTEKKINMESITLEKEDPYLAYWAQTLAPICGESMYKKFVQENEHWLSQSYNLKFTESSRRHLFKETKKQRWKQFWEWFLGGWLGNLLEGFLKLTIKKRTLSKKVKLGKKSNVVVSDDMLKFHNHDRRLEYREKWSENLNNY